MSMVMKPIRGVGQAVVILLIAQIVVAVVEALALAHRIDVLQQYRNGLPVATDLGTSADFVVTMRTIDSLAFVATVVVWCVWPHRSQRNAIQLTTGGLQFTPGWAVGWWFIPIANLWKPFQAVRELWKASHGGDVWQRVATWSVIGWWWGIWLASLVHINVGSLDFGTTPTDNQPTIGNELFNDKWMILSLVLRVIAAVLAIKIVRAVISLQEAAPPRAPMPPEPVPLPDPPSRPDTAG
jgi:hypothetical protein